MACSIYNMLKTSISQSSPGFASSKVRREVLSEIKGAENTCVLSDFTKDAV